MNQFLQSLDPSIAQQILEALGHSFPGVIAITDADVHILWANNAFVELTGYELDEVRGKKPKEFLQGLRTNNDTTAYMHQCIEAGVAFECEVLNYRKDGSCYWINLMARPIKDGDVVKCWIGTKIDITAKKAVDEALEHEKRALRESNLKLQKALKALANSDAKAKVQQRESNKWA